MLIPRREIYFPDVFSLELMRRNGFAEVCGPKREFSARGDRTVNEGKIDLPVEMTWYFVVGCNTCG